MRELIAASCAGEHGGADDNDSAFIMATSFDSCECVVHESQVVCVIASERSRNAHEYDVSFAETVLSLARINIIADNANTGVLEVVK